jgi:hypothetical protein
MKVLLGKFADYSARPQALVVAPRPKSSVVDNLPHTTPLLVPYTRWNVIIGSRSSPFGLQRVSPLSIDERLSHSLTYVLVDRAFRLEQTREESSESRECGFVDCMTR